MANNSSANPFDDLINSGAGRGKDQEGITVKTFVLNVLVSLALFVIEIVAFFWLKSSVTGRRIYQPKSYLVQERLRVEAVPANPIKWIRRIFRIEDEELKTKCGLDGYFFIRLLRAMIFIFVPMMAATVPVLLPINYHGGRGLQSFKNASGILDPSNVTGLDTLSWQNVAPDHTSRYWAHLVYAILAVCWTLYRIYREKLNFIDIRQRFLTSPEHRLKASARTVLITNIPNEYRSKEALEALYDVFVDNDDRSKLTTWVNRDYRSLRALVERRRSLRHSLEKEELKILREVNKHRDRREVTASKENVENPSQESLAPGNMDETPIRYDEQSISTAFDMDCHDSTQLWHKYLKASTVSQISLVQGKDGIWKPASLLKIWARGEKRKVPKIAWLRAEIARLTVQIEESLSKLDDEGRFIKQNSAFIQFDRQMSAHMACSLVSHNKAGRMSPRFLGVAPHEIIWRNMGITSLGRFFRTAGALILFSVMLFLWGIPTAILAGMAALNNLRANVSWLKWLQPWPSWVISLISGPLTAIVLALLVQLVVPALLRKLAILVGTPTRSKRELVLQDFYFAFLFIELVLVTTITTGIVNVVPEIIKNPGNIPNLLARDLPRSANYFFNYLVVQALGFTGSVLFQYLRVLYITMIWPWFTQTPRQEAWLQTTIPHQMWGNVYSLSTNFAVIGLIFSVISPLMLVFVSITFSLFWVAYRHNYYYVQRNKVDTHGLLFNNALSQMFTGIYVLEISLIGLFFLVRDTEFNTACYPQAIIMIVVLALTAIFHFSMEQHLRPLYEFLPVALEDPAADAERRRFLINDDEEATRQSRDGVELSDLKSVGKTDDGSDERAKKQASRTRSNNLSATAAHARQVLSRLKQDMAARVKDINAHAPELDGKTRRREVDDQLAAAIAGYPDELTDLSPDEREAEIKAAFQDPVTREPAPVIWIPQDPKGISEDVLKQARKYGPYLQYSNAGAYLTAKNKCEVTQPAPDVRPDWLLDWVL